MKDLEMKDLIKVIILIGLLIIAALQACSVSLEEEVNPDRFAAQTILKNDFYQISPNKALRLTVLQNDIKLPNTTLVFSHPAHGIIQIDSAAGGFVYLPEKDFKGKETFGYRVCAGRLCENAQVEILVQ